MSGEGETTSVGIKRLYQLQYILFFHIFHIIFIACEICRIDFTEIIQIHFIDESSEKKNCA